MRRQAPGEYAQPEPRGSGAYSQVPPPEPRVYGSAAVYGTPQQPPQEYSAPPEPRVYGRQVEPQQPAYPAQPSPGQQYPAPDGYAVPEARPYQAPGTPTGSHAVPPVPPAGTTYGGPSTGSYAVPKPQGTGSHAAVPQYPHGEPTSGSHAAVPSYQQLEPTTGSHAAPAQYVHGEPTSGSHAAVPPPQSYTVPEPQGYATPEPQTYGTPSETGTYAVPEPQGYAMPEPQAYGRSYQAAPGDEPTWASASLGLPASEQVRIPPPPRRRRRREWDDEEAWRETPRQDAWASPGRGDTRRQARNDEWLEVPHGGRRYDEPRMPRRAAEPAYPQQQPAYEQQQAPQYDQSYDQQQQYDPQQYAQEQQAYEQGGQQAPSAVRRADSRDARSERLERESTGRGGFLNKYTIIGVVCVLLLLAGVGYWYFGPQGGQQASAGAVPGITTTGVMEKLKKDGFTCMPPGKTIARCEKLVVNATFSVTIHFIDEESVTGIVANGGTGITSETKVTDKELQPFFAMAAGLPFLSPQNAAGAWVGQNIRKDGKSQFGGVTFETANGQDLLTMYTKKPVS